MEVGCVRPSLTTETAIPLIIKKGVLPDACLQNSGWPVKYTTANGDAMEGGATGLRVQVSLSVLSCQEQVLVQCDPMWAYVADLHVIDVIISYPFLEGFGLTVDAAGSCLGFSATRRQVTASEETRYPESRIGQAGAGSRSFTVFYQQYQRVLAVLCTFSVFLTSNLLIGRQKYLSPVQGSWFECGSRDCACK